MNGTLQAARSRPSKRRSARAIPICRDYAWRSEGLVRRSCESFKTRNAARHEPGGAKWTGLSESQALTE